MSCLDGHGFKASDFTRDEVPVEEAPAAVGGAATPAVPAPAIRSTPEPNVAAVSPSNTEPPSAPDLPIVPPASGAPSSEGQLGDGAEGGEVAPGPAQNPSLSSLSGSEVGIIGDSYIDFTTFTEHLQAHAREAGALGSSETYVDHALAGASMDGLPNIPAQWPEALADSRARGADGIRLVIMTGGGNDILVNNRQCLDFPSLADISDPCKAVVTHALDSALELFQQFSEDGVEALVFFYYPHLPQFSLLGGSHPNTMLDYSLPLVREQCETLAEMPCYFVDLSPSFVDDSGFARPELIAIDGIHPTDAGAVLMADDVWAVMVEHRLALE